MEKLKKLKNPNVSFYKNEIESIPEGADISTMHK